MKNTWKNYWLPNFPEPLDPETKECVKNESKTLLQKIQINHYLKKLDRMKNCEWFRDYGHHFVNRWLFLADVAWLLAMGNTGHWSELPLVGLAIGFSGMTLMFLYVRRVAIKKTASFDQNGELHS